MTDLSSLDTPISRATILDMSAEQLASHVESMRERRMRAYNLFHQAQELKAEAKHKADAERLDKVISIMEKTFKSVDTGLEKLSKYCNEVKLLKIELGD